jgi:NADH-quinone oxidoreductase subunit M
MAQKDFKRLVAYSSVSHMGYVVLGIGVWSAVAGNHWNPDAWKLGMNGAMFQMIAHGISSAGMFFLVGVLYDRVTTATWMFGGLFGDARLHGLAVGSSSRPEPAWLCGFRGVVILSVWNTTPLAVVAADVVLTAGTSCGRSACAWGRVQGHTKA